MADDPVLARRDGRVLVLTLNRPERLNAVTPALYERLIEQLEGADGDPGVRAVVLTGNGRAFCAGADLKAHAELPPTGEERRRYAQTAQRANLLLQTIGAPVVAAVNGHAIGGGLELALSCDFLFVAEEAKLRLPELALGTFVGGGVTYTLAERVGVPKAREILYLGDFMLGREAAEIGLADRALPAAEVLDAALERAARLAAQAPRSMAALKRIMGSAGRRPRETTLAAERDALAELFGTADWQEGIDAFREGRTPDYRGE